MTPNHNAEAVFGVICALILATCCAGLWLQWWRARRDERTDAKLRAGMRQAYRRGLLARHSVFGEMWMEDRK